jgi:hypothetical protein
MAQNFPGNASPGGGFRAAPYSRPFTAAAVLNTQVDQAQCATSGALLFVTTATPTLTYKDATGTSVVLDAAIAGCAVGAVVDLANISMIEIVAITNCTLLAYWHGSGART